MPDYLQDMNVSTAAGPLFIMLIFAEIIAIRFRGAGGQYETKDAVTSVFMGAGSGIIDGLLAFVSLGVLMFFYKIAPFKIPTNWTTGAICFILYDLSYYIAHRYYHSSRWAWASHVVHHSSQHYNLTTALRQTWTGLFTGSFILFVPWAFLGFHPALIFLCGGLNLIYQFWFHTEFIDKCPRWFEAIMNTPSHHRVHHAKNPRYLDANYAGVFIVWDKMFGSFVPEQSDEPPRYGLVKDIGTFNPLRIFSHEYVAIWNDIITPGLSLKQRFAYIFALPGWCHNGGRLTSRQIKAAYLTRFPGQAGRPGLRLQN